MTVYNDSHMCTHPLNMHGMYVASATCMLHGKSTSCSVIACLVIHSVAIGLRSCSAGGPSCQLHLCH